MVLVSILLVMAVISIPIASAEIIDGDKDKCIKHKYDGECDTKKPSLTITSPHNHAKVGNTVTITGTASDSGPEQTGLKSVSVSIDGGASAPATVTGGTWTFTATMTKGTHVIHVTAQDNALNFNKAHITIKVI